MVILGEDTLADLPADVGLESSVGHVMQYSDGSPPDRTA